MRPWHHNQVIAGVSRMRALSLPVWTCTRDAGCRRDEVGIVWTASRATMHSLAFIKTPPPWWCRLVELEGLRAGI